MHAKSQLVPLHVAVAFAGGWQGVHDTPQVAGEPLDAQVSPQRCVPATQVKSHAPFAHIGVELSGAGHCTHASPQCATSSAVAQTSPHAWRPLAQTQRLVAPSQAPG